MKKLLVLLALASIAPAYAVTVITDFEGFNTTAPSGTIMFRNPSFSGSTSAKMDASVNSSVISDAVVGSNASKKLKVDWLWLSTATDLYLRLTTFGATSLPNPAISLNDNLVFDVYVTKDLYLGIGVRETNTTAPIGGNGGTTGTIELISNEPLNLGPRTAQLIKANTWTTVVIDLPKLGLPGGPYTRGFTGDGAVTSTTGMVALEMLYLAPVGGNIGPYTMYLDNFRQADAVPEPMTLIGLGAGLGALALRRRKK